MILAASTDNVIGLALAALLAAFLIVVLIVPEKF